MHTAEAARPWSPEGQLWITDLRREIDPAIPGDGLPGQVWTVDVASASADIVVEEGPIFVNGLGTASIGSW